MDKKLLVGDVVIKMEQYTGLANTMDPEDNVTSANLIGLNHNCSRSLINLLEV